MKNGESYLRILNALLTLCVRNLQNFPPKLPCAPLVKLPARFGLRLAFNFFYQILLCKQ
jgi:hypothetical protein